MDQSKVRMFNIKTPIYFRHSRALIFHCSDYIGCIFNGMLYCQFVRILNEPRYCINLDLKYDCVIQVQGTGEYNSD